MIKLKDLIPAEYRIDEQLDVPPPQKIQEPPAIIQQANTDRQYKIDLLTVISCLILEAGGEGDQGMQAVMNVIQNRAKSNDPHELAAKVLQRYQFEAFNKYTVGHSQRLADIVSKAHKHPKWNEAAKLVFSAVEGKLPDITNGADHYYNPKTVVKIPTWSNVYAKTVTIGSHDFHSSKNRLTESINVDEDIQYLESLIDASDKFRNSEDSLDEDGDGHMKRISRFENKWNRHPLKFNEVESVKQQIKNLKKQKFSKLI